MKSLRVRCAVTGNKFKVPDIEGTFSLTCDGSHSHTIENKPVESGIDSVLEGLSARGKVSW
jgi:hypothetical protein